jgi:hypothetical protein
MKPVITPLIHQEIKKRLKKGKFEGYVSLYNWVKETHITDIKYGTISHYVRRHFKNPSSPKRIENFKVTERLTELKKLSMELDHRKQKRVQMLMFLKAKKFKTMKSLATELGANVFTVRNWMNSYQNNGLTELLK